MAHYPYSITSVNDSIIIENNNLLMYNTDLNVHFFLFSNTKVYSSLKILFYNNNNILGGVFF